VGTKSQPAFLRSAFNFIQELGKSSPESVIGLVGSCFQPEKLMEAMVIRRRRYPDVEEQFRKTYLMCGECTIHDQYSTKAILQLRKMSIELLGSSKNNRPPLQVVRRVTV
jgi:hypothetical protein